MKMPSWEAMGVAESAAPPVTIYADPDYVPGPNSLRAYDLGHLGALVGTIAMRIGQIENMHDAGTFLRDTMQHEGEHAEVAKLAEATGLTFGVHFFRSESGGTLLYAYHRHDPLKDAFAHAVVALYPSRLSRRDVAIGKHLGHDVASLAGAIPVHNARHGTRYPLPLSHKQSTAAQNGRKPIGRTA